MVWLQFQALYQKMSQRYNFALVSLNRLSTVQRLHYKRNIASQAGRISHQPLSKAAIFTCHTRLQQLSLARNGSSTKRRLILLILWGYSHIGRALVRFSRLVNFINNTFIQQLISIPLSRRYMDTEQVNWQIKMLP